MAIRIPAIDRPAGTITYVTWAGLLNGDTGTPTEFDNGELVSWQAFGTFGSGGNVSIEATNEAAPTTYAGADSLTAAGIVFSPVPRCARNFRPRVTAGDGTTSLTVIGAFRRIL